MDITEAVLMGRVVLGAHVLGFLVGSVCRRFLPAVLEFSESSQISSCGLQALRKKDRGGDAYFKCCQYVCGSSGVCLRGTAASPGE